MFSRTSLAILFAICAASLSAQGFLKSYSPASSSIREVLQTADGGYFAVGRVTDDNTIFLLRTDAAGQELWKNQVSLNGANATTVSATPDGGFVVLAENYADAGLQKNVILKVSPTGNVDWQTVIEGNTFANGLRDIVALPDGNFLAAGNAYDLSFSIKNWIVKIAPDGSVIWQKVFGALTRNIRRLILLPSGNVAAAGHADDFYLAQLTADGNLVWEQSYPEPGAQTCYDLLATTDGNIALLGTSPTPTPGSTAVLNICVLKTDLNGNRLWLQNNYPFPLPDPFPNSNSPLPVLNSFAQDGAGNFYVPFWGFFDIPLDTKLELLKLAPDGTALSKNSPEVVGNAWYFIPTSDNYFVIAGDNNGLPTNAMLLKVDSEGQYFGNRITGNVFRDNDADCTQSLGEPGLPDFIVKAENQAGEAFFKKVNSDGSYEIRVSEGEFAVTAGSVYGPPAAFFLCDTPTVTLIGAGQAVAAPPIGVQMLAECPVLDLEISGGILRRCSTVLYSLNWCNTGNLTAEAVSLQISADPLLSYASSTIPLASQNGDVYTFELGEVPIGACGDFQIRFDISCAATTNDVICVEAHIFPDTTCIPPDSNLDGSVIEVTGICTGSEIEFKIKNTGTGDMTQLAEYVIIEDQIMYMQVPIQLNANEEMTTARVPMLDDSCFALRVFPNQTSVLSKPVAVVENCTSDGNLSLLLSLPNNENELSIATYCGAVIGSFDPNDKIGLPLGLTSVHYLERGDAIEYTTRFQNTGNDTAFLVTIRDTLPATLDPATFHPIAASHAYTWDLTDGGILTFTFPQILLPDSTSNEPGSHGFVSFRIGQKLNLPDGTLIENTASIYFDFNDPIVTNTWLHTIGRPSIVGTQDLPHGSENIKVLIAPNPMADEAVFALQDYLPKKPMRFALFDPLGKKLFEEEFWGSEFLWRKKSLPTGLYFWQINEAGKTLARGRVVRR